MVDMNDTIRFHVLHVWTNTMEKTANSNLEGLKEAKVLALKDYQALKRLASPEIICTADVQETLASWATWHAITCQIIRRRPGKSYTLSAFLRVFTRDLEKELSALTLMECSNA
jgi:hypothetical protein